MTYVSCVVHRINQYLRLSEHTRLNVNRADLTIPRMLVVIHVYLNTKKTVLKYLFHAKHDEQR